jgi:hypothetical protein
MMGGGRGRGEVVEICGTPPIPKKLNSTPKDKHGTIEKRKRTP